MFDVVSRDWLAEIGACVDRDELRLLYREAEKTPAPEGAHDDGRSLRSAFWHMFDTLPERVASYDFGRKS